MSKLVILASVVVLAMSSVNCANSQGANPVSPSISGLGGAATAARGGNGKGPNSGTVATVALVLVDDANGNGAPDYGDTITFNVSTTATDQPQVSLACYQSGNVVASGSWP